jgi:hypothetical protein
MQFFLPLFFFLSSLFLGYALPILPVDPDGLRYMHPRLSCTGISFSTRSPGGGGGVNTYEAGLTAVIDIDEVRVQIQVAATAHLDGGIRGPGSGRAGRKGELGEEAVGWQRHLGVGGRGEGGRVVDLDFLDGRVRGLGPGGFQRAGFCHLGIRALSCGSHGGCM